MNIKNLYRGAYGRYITPMLLKKEYGELLNKNRKLRNTEKGKRCFILGNGPSLKNQDLTKLHNEETFVVNSFWHHPDYKKINPKNYVLIDSYAFPQKDNPELGQAMVQDLVDRNQTVSSCPSRLFFHAIGKDFIEEKKLFSTNDIYYLVFNRFFTDNLKFNIDPSGILPNTKNVIICCILLAVYMGFEEIYLLGCEHNFLAYPAAKHYDNFKHFYKTNYSTNNPEDVKNYALNEMPYERHIDHAKILFKNYRLLKNKLAKEYEKVKIYNATPNSFLDVFPLVKYEDIICH